ncbi:transposase, partial [Bifidobacterium apri]
GSRAAADAAWTLAADELASTDPRAARTFAAARDECLAYMAFPKDHWLRIRTNNVQERENREIKRRTSSVGVFPSRDALQRLVGAVLMEADEEWSTDRRIWSPENTSHAWDAPDTHTPTAAELAAARSQARAAFDALDTTTRQEQE